MYPWDIENIRDFHKNIHLEFIYKNDRSRLQREVAAESEPTRERESARAGERERERGCVCVCEREFPSRMLFSCGRDENQSHVEVRLAARS